MNPPANPHNRIGHSLALEDHAQGPADGLLIEVHSHPECALCDGEESIKPAKFKELMHDMSKIAQAIGREI